MFRYCIDFSLKKEVEKNQVYKTNYTAYLDI